MSLFHFGERLIFFIKNTERRRKRSLEAEKITFQVSRVPDRYQPILRKGKDMTKSDVKKRIAKAIQELNAMDNNVCFAFEETEYSVELSCQSRFRKETSYGIYSFMGMFDDYRHKIDAYVNCMLFAEVIIAATRLNDPAAYHNLSV